MVSRRDFLRSGTVAGVSTLLPGGIALADPWASADTPLELDLILDARYREIEPLRLIPISGNSRINEVTADPTPVLKLLPRAIKANRPVMGLTPDATLMIAEQIATEAGFVLNYKGTHSPGPEGDLSHQITGDVCWLGDFGQAIIAAAGDWSGVIARFAEGLSTAASVRGSLDLQVAAKAQPGAGRLVSWVFIPA